MQVIPKTTHGSILGKNIIAFEGLNRLYSDYWFIVTNIPHGRPGDSGSAVINKEGRLIGMYYGVIREWDTLFLYKIYYHYILKIL